MKEDKPRVDLRVIRTRRLIKDAVIDLLHEVDINKLTVNRIAQRAQINRVTFYLHYKDIPDMLEKMVEEMIDEIDRIRVKQAGENTIEKPEWETLVNLLEHIAENAKFFKVVLITVQTPIFHERFIEIISELVKDSTEIDSLLNKADIQKDIATWYVTSAISGTIISWMQNDMPYSPKYLAKQISLLFAIMKWNTD